MDIKERAQAYQNDIIEGIRSLVAIRSVEEEPKDGMPFGEGPAKALQHILAMGKSLGFEKVVNLDNYAGYIEIGEGKDLVGILCHVDIVPEGDNWTHEPFGGEIENGHIYGRGVCDNKGPAVICLYVLKIIQDMGIPLKKRVRLVLGANEESGFKCMEYYRAQEGGFQMGFSPDAAFPLIFGEKGVADLSVSAEANGEDSIRLTDIFGGEAKNVVAPSCTCKLEGDENALKGAAEKFKAFAQEREMQHSVEQSDGGLTLKLEGVPAHASRPELGVNAITHMLLFLGGVMPKSPFIAGFNAYIGTDLKGEHAGIAAQDEYGDLTLNVGLIKYQNGRITADLNIRYPITINFSPLTEKFKNTLNTVGIELEAGHDNKPLFVDPDSAFVQSLYACYREITGDTENEPFTIGGGTYARAFENVVAYGIEFPGDENHVHMSDEVLSIDKIRLATEIYTNAACRLAEL